MKVANMSTQQQTPGMFYVIAFAALLAELAATVAVSGSHMLEAFGLHIWTLALIGLWIVYIFRRTRDRSSLYLLPLTAAGGPFGAGISLLSAFVYARGAADAASPSEWIEDLFTRNQDRESDQLHERISFGLDNFESTSGVEPFRDILSGGGVLQKQMAIAKIARHFRPAFAPLLLQAARDSNAAVRVQAATALAKIERDFMARYIKLENELRDLPDNDPAKLELAELYDDYAHANLLDDNNRQTLRHKAIAIYEACLAYSDNPDWRIKLARLYLRENQPGKTCECLRPLIETADPPRGATFWYMEALFQLKKFDELRQIASHQAPIIRLSTEPSLGEIESLPGVWEGTGVWEATPVRKAAS